VAEHQQVLQPAFAFEALKAQQRAERFAGAGTGIDQHIVMALALQPTPQQRDQLRLPLARLHRGMRAQPAHGRDALQRLTANGLQRAPGQAQIERRRTHPAILLPVSEKR
jgi:hypothetical protein